MVDPLLPLLHAMQSGVAQFMELDGKEATLKHLRTGLGATCADHAALVAVLQSKLDLPEDIRERAVMRNVINCTMCDHGALVKCLADAGFIKMDEYMAARRVVLEADVKTYEQAMSAHYGARIKLG